MTTYAIPPDRIFLYLLDKDDSILEGNDRLVVYQKDLSLAVNTLKDDNKVLGDAMRKLVTLLSVVIVFPSERYIPTEEDVKKLREAIE